VGACTQDAEDCGLIDLMLTTPISSSPSALRVRSCACHESCLLSQVAAVQYSNSFLDALIDIGDASVINLGLTLEVHNML
jgi:hypothetical protein